MKPKAWIGCEDPGETFPLLMSGYAVKVKVEGRDMPAYKAAAPFGKQRCWLWGLLHGYGWLQLRS